MQGKFAIIGPGNSGKSLAISALHEIKDLIVKEQKPDPTPLPKIVIKPFHYAYMRSEADPTPTFFRTRHRKS